MELIKFSGKESSLKKISMKKSVWKVLKFFPTKVQNISALYTYTMNTMTIRYFLEGFLVIVKDRSKHLEQF